jgi:hypothetical protein
VELLFVYVVLAGALVAPFAGWVYARRARWRSPGRAVVRAYAVALGVVLAASAAFSYFYPFGRPGPSERAWRAAATECQRRYAGARTAGDTAAADGYQPPTAGADRPPPMCHALRVAGLTSAARWCAPGSRCARLRAALGLPAT